MSDFESLVFYIFVFLLSFLFYYLYSRKGKKIYLIISFLIMLFVGGFRDGVGTDYYTYIAMYNNSSGILGFRIISIIASIFYGSRTLIILFQFLTLLFVFLGMKEFDKKTQPFIYLCFLFLYYISSYNIMKQALAMSIVFYALKYIKNKDFIKWLLFSILASIFHQTAILFVFLYFIMNTKKKSVRFFSFILLLIISLNYSKAIVFLSNYSFFAKYLSYSGEYLKTVIANRSSYIEIITLIYILFLRKKLVNSKPDLSMYIFIYCLGTVLLFTGFFSPYVKRISYYLLMTKIVILPYIPVLYNNKKKRLLNYIILFSYVLIMFIISTYYLGHSGVIPYNFSLK